MAISDKFQQLSELKKMRSQAMALQRELAEEKVEIEEKGIKIIISGDQKLKRIEIEGEEQQKLVKVLNKAIKESQKIAAKRLQSMSGGLSGLLGG